jgi:Flp pilus assembly pilin Flp
MPEEIRERYQYFTEARMERLRAAGVVAPFTPVEDGVARYVARLARGGDGSISPPLGSRRRARSGNRIQSPRSDAGSTKTRTIPGTALAYANTGREARMKINSFPRGSSGQALSEYLILLLLVAVVTVAAAQSLGGTIKKKFQLAREHLSKDLALED